MLQGLFDSDTRDDDDYFCHEEVNDPKIISSLSLLLLLFSVCRHPNCGQACDPGNITWSYKGAMITITALCNGHHMYTWKSSPMLGKGKSQVPVINILLGTYAYICGVNVKKVIF